MTTSESASSPAAAPSTPSAAGTPSGRRLRVAVVGAGPAGFYTVEALVKQKERPASVDLFERLPAPYGLVRYGVAPDHQKIKSVTVAYDKLGARPDVRYFGNVSIGHGAISVEDLFDHYDHVVFTVGCETDRRLGIPGEDLEGSHAATSFVAWYNGHPDFADYRADLRTERAAIVGIGDVAMDLSRLLVRPYADLRRTDMANAALAAFAESRVREIVVLARRGPAQAAFAAKELEDIVELPGVHVSVDREHVRADLAACEADHQTPHHGLLKRKLEFLAHLAEKEPKPGDKRVVLRFFASPVRLHGEAGRVTGIEIERNQLVTDERGRTSARGTGVFETLPVGLVFRSVGYRGVPIPGLPFDDGAGIVPNADGRVLRNGHPWPNVYVAGWIKRGPSGVIGTNKSDAAHTVQKMLEDAPALDGTPEKSGEGIVDVLRERGIHFVTYPDWKALDAIEVERGKASGKVREKLVRVPEMLGALGPR
ncbi:MAG TPA: FAD-dependent oxidoreductase [Polyangiaceae bacterium]|nr:FAD-dependent oxidoreductase [Polyangiaceae bacterium]